MTFKEIKKQIEEIGISDIIDGYDIPKTFPKFKQIPVKNQYDDGDENIELVLHFTALDIYVKITGMYASYQGHSWDDKITQVYPKEETVIVYSPKKIKTS